VQPNVRSILSVPYSRPSSFVFLLLHAILFSKLIYSFRTQEARVGCRMSAFKRRRAQFETPHCPSCESTNIVTDNRQGHLVCDDCGVILESSMISTATEYRNFSESDKPTGTLDAPAFHPLLDSTFCRDYPDIKSVR
jgi:ribosomal protein S27E